MSGKRKSETTISAAHEEKKPKDSQSIIVHSSGATSTNTMTTPTSVQNSLQPLLDTTNSPQGAAQPKRIKATTPLQPEQPIPSVPQSSTPTLSMTPLPPQQNATPSPVTAPPLAVTPGTAPEGGQGQQIPTLMAFSHCIKPVLLHK